MDIIKQLKNKTARKVLFAMLYIRKASGENEFEAEAKDINRLCLKAIELQAKNTEIPKRHNKNFQKT